MKVWIEVRVDVQHADVLGVHVNRVFTDYEDAMMYWGGQANMAEKEGAAVSENGGVYRIDHKDRVITIQEVEL